MALHQKTEKKEPLLLDQLRETIEKKTLNEELLHLPFDPFHFKTRLLYPPTNGRPFIPSVSVP